MEKVGPMSAVQTPAGAVQTPAGADFERFVEMSRHVSSIDLRAYKPAQMERRLRSLMRRRAISDFDSYAKLLRRDFDLRQEFEHFVTINVTQFYRDPERFKALERELQAMVGARREPLHVWSAGCANGSEPFTVAMILATLAPGVPHRIFATDIDEDSLAHARRGAGFTEGHLETLPPAYRRNFTVQERDTGAFELAPKIRSMVRFARHDLVRDPYRRGFDLILCRNVVIYFSDATKRSIFSRFYGALNPGGLLFIGATELISGAGEIGYEQRGHGLFRRPGH
jgi:chemotaxis protein methyltransferase CheR